MSAKDGGGGPEVVTAGRATARNSPRPIDGVSDGRPVIVFDAVCVLCSAHARFVLRRDRAGLFRLASVQGEAGRELCRASGVDPDDPETLIVLDGARVHRESDAVLAIWRGLGWPWRAASVLGWVPRRLRDPAYRWVARHRYRLFGRRESCWVPSPEHASRIL